VRIVLAGVLPRIYSGRMRPQFIDIRRLLQALVEKQRLVLQTTPPQSSCGR
jgi:hypothetical protein